MSSNSTHSFATFKSFYTFYLGEHQNRTCRRLHFIGSTGVLVLLSAFVATRHLAFLIAIPLCGYGFAWVGHFFFEKNKPATFKHPLRSLIGDWVMFGEILRGKIRF